LESVFSNPKGKGTTTSSESGIGALMAQEDDDGRVVGENEGRLGRERGGREEVDADDDEYVR